MKHFHFNFIIASLAIGLGLLLFIDVAWQVRLLSFPGARMMPLAWLQLCAFMVGSCVLLTFGWNGVRAEIMETDR